MTGALTHSAAVIIQQLLIDLGLGTDPGDDDDWPVYAYRAPDTPDEMISVHNTTGIHQGRLQINGEVVERYGFNIAIRDNVPETGYEKARAIAVALDESVNLRTVTITEVVGTATQAYTVYSISRASGPIDAGREPTSGRNLFTINATVALKQD